jgi:hypothetical protein
VAIQLHLGIKFEVSLLDGFLDLHPEDPAVVDGVRVPVVEATVTFLLYSIGPKHGMPFRQPDSAFLHQELKQLVGFSDVEIIGAFGLFDPALIHSQWLFSPHDFGRSHVLAVIRILHLVDFFQELIVDICHVVLFAEPDIFLETVGLVAHQRQLLGQLTQVVELHVEQLFTHGWQHPGNGHVGQLVIWQIERKTHALNFPEPPEELQGRLTVSLLQGS